MTTNIFAKVILGMVFFSLASCACEDCFKNKGLVPINKKISGSFSNSPISENNIKWKLADFFDLKKNDSVVNINSREKTVFITYVDGLGAKHCKAFEGKFRERSFEFYLEYNTILVPPLIVSTQKTSVRLSLDKDANLVINKSYDHSGMLLLFGAGSSGGFKCVFTKIN